MQGGLFLVVQARQDAPRLDHAGIGVDVELRRIRDEIEAALLRRKHRDVLVEGGLDLLEDAIGELGILDVEVVRLAQK